MEKVHFVYRTTCLMNGKQYVGVHSTYDVNDGYLGSSRILQNDIRKFGRHQFNREILSFHPTRESAFTEERILVNEDWIQRDDTYNMFLGGCVTPVGHLSEKHKRKIGAANKGNKRPDLAEWNRANLTGKRRGPQSEEHKQKKSKALREYYVKHWRPSTRRPNPPSG
jgi:hypothetical protein